MMTPIVGLTPPRIDTHPRTGAAQIVEIRETVEEIVVQ